VLIQRDFLIPKGCDIQNRVSNTRVALFRARPEMPEHVKPVTTVQRATKN
jgi:hypothetical protein